jgi:hypothetical protein
MTLADNLPLTGWKRVVALATAMVISTWVNGRRAASTSTRRKAPQRVSYLAVAVVGRNAGQGPLSSITYCTPIALVFSFAGAMRRVRRAPAAELARQEMERKRLPEFDLQTMQARVERISLRYAGDIGSSLTAIA